MGIRMPAPLAAAAFLWTAVFWAVCVGIPVASLLSRLHGPSLADPEVLSLARLTVFQAGGARSFRR